MRGKGPKITIRKSGEQKRRNDIKFMLKESTMIKIISIAKLLMEVVI